MPRPKRLGAYAPLSATYFQDDALAEAGEAAELLYCRGLAFCAQSMSDGFISDLQLTRFVGVGMRDAKKRAAKLVEVGSWERVEGGYVVRSWLKWNRSAAEIGMELRKDRERKAAGKGPDGPPPTRPHSGRNPNGIHPESERIPGTVPNGVRTDSALAYAGARPIHFNSLHVTTQQGTESGGIPTEPGLTETLLSEYLASCRKQPPAQIVEQLGRHTHELIAQGIDLADVRAGIAAWSANDKGLPPSLLPSFVNNAMNANPATAPGSATTKATGWLQLAADTEAQQLRAIPGEAS